MAYILLENMAAKPNVGQKVIFEIQRCQNFYHISVFVSMKSVLIDKFQ